MSGSETISPTAHYTGWVWSRNGLSHPELATTQGRLLFEAVRPSMILSRALGTGTLEGFLLARHHAIDALLERAIEDDGVGQVIEVACGLSARGWRFAQRYRQQVTYVEADLPDMAERKRACLERMGGLGPGHRVEVVDALSDESVEDLASRLDENTPTAIITEGLLGYFDRDDMLGMWRRFADVLGQFPSGRYLSDTYTRSDMHAPHVRAFRHVLGAFVRGQVHIHFEDTPEIPPLLTDAGFDEAVVHRAEALAPSSRDAGARLVWIIDARVK